MYTEELEGFEEADQKTPPNYAVNFSQQEAEKLARDNEKLKKNLEKEKFFNKLLDQEIKDLKTQVSSTYPGDYNTQSKGISKGAFFAVLILALALAGFIAYNYFNTDLPVGSAAINERNNEVPTEAVPEETVPAVKDSVPNIIAKSPVTEKAVAPSVQKIIAPPVENKNEPVVVKEVPLKKQPATVKSEVVAEKETVADVPAPPAPVSPQREIIGKYKVTSKANFYNSADENTLRSAYINGGNKTVNALEEKNGFIYVEYTNDYGTVTKGWLSKKDITQE